MSRRGFFDRLLGREVDRVHDQFVETMKPKPADEVEAAIAEALALIEEERRKKAAQRAGRKLTPPVPVPRPARIPSIPEDM